MAALFSPLPRWSITLSCVLLFSANEACRGDQGLAVDEETGKATIAQSACPEFSVSRWSDGGFAGGGDGFGLLVNPDGSARAFTSEYRDYTGTPPEELRCRLWQAIEEIDFFNLPESVAPESNPHCCCDQYTYSITVTFEGESKTVSFCHQSPETGPIVMACWEVGTWLEENGQCTSFL